MSVMTSMPVLPAFGGALIASPSSALREQVLHHLNGRWQPVQQALGGAEALVKLEKGSWQVLFLDRRLPDLDVEEVVGIIRLRFPGTQVVLLDSDTPEPLQDAAAANSCETTAQAFVRQQGPRFLPAHPQSSPLPGMIGTSDAMQRVYRMVRLVAPRMTTVLVAGPTGSGKELVACGLHALSPRAAKPIVVVNCAAIPEALLESELFGYARGAFTGAVHSQVGRIPAAQRGDSFPRRDQRVALGNASQASALSGTKRSSAPGYHGNNARRRARGRREQCRSGRLGWPRQVSRRSLLPALGVSHRITHFGGKAR
jgi:CheY-like chemotaxis protein